MTFSKYNVLLHKTKYFDINVHFHLSQVNSKKSTDFYVRSFHNVILYTLTGRISIFVITVFQVGLSYELRSSIKYLTSHRKSKM